MVSDPFWGGGRGGGRRGDTSSGGELASWHVGKGTRAEHARGTSSGGELASGHVGKGRGREAKRQESKMQIQRGKDPEGQNA